MAEAKPLAGITVAEIGGDVAVRYCGRLFARYGADVVRFEDGAAAVDPLFGAWLDQGKRIVASRDDVLAGRRLVICGQTREQVAAAEAALPVDATLMAISWFDPRGPYADWAANDAIIQAMSGIAFNFGPAEGPPTLPQGYAPQILGGATAFIGALASLFGEPVRKVESSIFEAALCFAETGAVGAAVLNWEARRLGVNRFAPTCPCRIYRTSDGWAGLTALTYPQWAALAGLIGRPELAAEARLATSLQRLAVGDELDVLLAAEFLKRPTDDWAREGIARRIPITPAPPPSELPALPHWRDRGAFEPVAGGAAQGPATPFRFHFEGERKPRTGGGPAGPLDGVRVADFSMGWAGPLAARYLADLGADVLKIESSAHPDWWRGWDPRPDSDPPLHELPRNFMAVNRNKRGLDLDLAQPDQRAAAEAIIAAADLVLDNQGPGVMVALGLGPADQRRMNPSVVSVSMPPFGRDGPLAGLRAYGSTVEQASGMPFVNGREDWDPCQQHVAYGDPVAGVYAAAAALVGLWGRERLGGADVEVCQVECLFQLGAASIIAETAAGGRLPRTGSRRASAAPCVVVEGIEADTWLTIAVDSDAAWQGLARAIERPDMAADAGLATLAGRKRREDELEAAVAEWASALDTRAAAELLQAAGVPAAPVLPTHQLFPDPHLQDCGYWAVQDRRYIGIHFTPHAPLRFDGERLPVIRPAPTMGEHTAEVLAELGIA
ncbi:MAG TPA: CoA transferase [Caulobacteraceae bacterium]|nr:CoA transferase [Caulobacteraceae bacterium]